MACTLPLYTALSEKATLPVVSHAKHSSFLKVLLLLIHNLLRKAVPSLVRPLAE